MLQVYTSSQNGVNKLYNDGKQKSIILSNNIPKDSESERHYQLLKCLPFYGLNRLWVFLIQSNLKKCLYLNTIKADKVL
jgi:hypothetical protein